MPELSPLTATQVPAAAPVPEAPVALLGWSLEAMEAMTKAGRPFVAVVPPEFEAYMKEHDLQHVLWDFDLVNDRSNDLARQLTEAGVRVAVPLYEETVEWAGAVNARLREDPRLFNRALLFRDKAMMKRKAQISGIRVGVFEEVETRDQVGRFLDRVNAALLKQDEETPDPVHLKPLRASGSVGHMVVRTWKDVANIPDDSFPCLIESNLAGQEFSVEAWVHAGKIRFLNITEYVRLGHSNFVPASPRLESQRDRIHEAVQQLVEAFGIEYGVIHPEYFLTSDGVLNFGEVAARVPGGHIFELIEKAWGFDPYLAMILCSDPDTPEEVLEEVLPRPGSDAKQVAGCLMVYPRQQTVEEMRVPDEVLEHPYFERHNLFQPVTRKVRERVGFGNHYGTLYLRGSDPETMRDLLERWEKVDFYQ